MFAHPYRCLRPEVYKPLPDGWAWPPAPIPQDRSIPRPKTKKRKKRIPQSVLDEWRGFARPRPSTDPSTPPPPTSITDPLSTMVEADGTVRDVSLEPDVDISDGDSALGEIPDELDDHLGLDEA